MVPVTFTEARELILRLVRSAAAPEIETVPLPGAANRVLARDCLADRDYPPVARSTRDGFALRSTEAPRGARVIGEVRAGESFAGEVGPGEAVEIMTGAPVPRGANAVVMVEDVRRDGDRITTDRVLAAGESVNPRGSEARQGDIVAARGRRLDYTGIAALAATGHTGVPVYRRPSVAILATGDEVVAVGDTPREFEVRNSNSFALAAQVARAGGVPEILPVARDNHAATLELIGRGLASDLLLVSGGVSAGKYDLVERVLADCEAEFYFDRVRIQPGQPLVFGRARGTFFFGLPGNPVSTMVTFEVLARAALELLGGEAEPVLPFTAARLSEPFRHRPGLTRFLPAALRDTVVTPVRSAGSGDVAAMARANAYLVADPDRDSYGAGDWIRVLLK